jgi:hypothetical protein
LDIHYRLWIFFFSSLPLSSNSTSSSFTFSWVSALRLRANSWKDFVASAISVARCFFFLVVPSGPLGVVCSAQLLAFPSRDFVQRKNKSKSDHQYTGRFQHFASSPR